LNTGIALSLMASSQVNAATRLNCEANMIVTNHAIS
jgi:hypothetical protein